MIGGIMQMLYPEQMRNEEIKLQQDKENQIPYVVRWPENLGPKPDEKKILEMIAEHESAYHIWYANKKAKSLRRVQAIELLTDEKVVVSLLEAKNKRINKRIVP